MRDRPVFHEGFGAFLASQREAKGWSLRGAAAQAKRWSLPLSYQVLFRLEGGQTKNPNGDVLRAVAQLYRLPYEELAARVVSANYGLQIVRKNVEPQDTTVDGFVAIPLLARPIAAGEPLVTEPDPEQDGTLAFREDLIRTRGFERPICFRIGRREESMLPLIQPHDVVLIDQNERRRAAPQSGNIFAVNFAPLTGDPGGAVKRIERDRHWLIVSSQNEDKDKYPTRAHNIEDKDILDVLKGEVVWFGRYLGTGRGKR